MNEFGRIFRISIFGESHGEGVGILLDGVPPGIVITTEELKRDIERRKSGKLGTTSRKEEDDPIILSGVFENRTTGAPVNIFFKNNNKISKDYEKFREHPRPGHSDFVASKKFNEKNDIRGGGIFSGRLTLGLVVAGVFAKKILAKLSNIEIESKVISLGKYITKDIDNLYEDDKVLEYLKEIKNERDSIGGVIKCEGRNIPIGLGEPFFDSTESIISHLIFSIPGVKGIEFGIGFEGSKKLGSQCNDMIISSCGLTSTNNCGGINGGLTNGNKIEFNVAVKPTSSIGKIQRTFNLKNDKIEELKIDGRHDVAFVLRVPVILESCLAIVLADLILINRTLKF